MTSNAAKRITIYEVAELFCKAYDKSAGIETARKGFETSGIWPYDDQKFTDKDFVAAEVTDEPITTVPVSAKVVQISDCPVPSASTDPVPSTSVSAGVVQTPVPSTSASTDPVPSTSVSAGVVQTQVPLQTQVPSTSASSDPVPSNSTLLVHASPAQCEPHPGLEEARRILNELSPRPKLQSSRPRTRKAESAVILTSSPYKALLHEKSSKLTPRNEPAKRSRTESGKTRCSPVCAL